MLVISGLTSVGPNIISKMTKEDKKKTVSTITVYKTMETALAAEIFSCERKKTATADPPMLVGEIAEANSQINTNSIDCLKLKS